MQRRHIFYLVLTIVLIVAALVWAFLPAPIAVEVSAVRQGLFEQTIDEDGKTRVRERYVMSAPLAGRLARITLDPGDVVQAGKPVATIAPSVPALLDARTVRELEERFGAAEAAYAQSKAEEVRASAALEQAQADAARQSKLQADGFVSPAAREQTQLAVRLATQAQAAARSALDAAGHNMAQARAALARVRIDPMDRDHRTRTQALPVIAPISGHVLRVVQESEAVVAMGAPLLEVAQTADLEVVVDVLSTEALRITSGMPVRLDAGPTLRLDGVVRRVEPGAFTKVSALGVEEQRVNVIIDLVAKDEPAPKLGDGYRVDARIITTARADAVLVPVAALFRHEGQWAVFVVQERRVQLRLVKVGGRNTTEAQVEEGLVPGETVVVYPGDLLADGKRIKVLRQSQ